MAFRPLFLDSNFPTPQSDLAQIGGAVGEDQNPTEGFELGPVLGELVSWAPDPFGPGADEFDFGSSGDTEWQTWQSSFDRSSPKPADIAPIDTDASAKPDGSGGGGSKGGGKGGKGDGGGDTGLLSEYVSDADNPDGYNVEIIFKGSWTAALQDAFIVASEAISSIILGDVTDILRGRFATDDITITAELAKIDGVGNILGQAGPTAYRTADYLPVSGIMQFDVADAQDFDGRGLFDDIVFHEMLHTLGFGTMWDLMGLTSGTVADGDMIFTGAMATQYYKGDVPIETDGGAGTAGGHWDDDTFGNEIMTGYINETNYLSELTVAALEDMGYDTYLDGPGADLTGPDPLSGLNGTLFA
ncbi:MAG: leishmanolysin-related zinc metalloendopeptidase [Thalassovita sp.]|nr:leishmanolysin-related zinc metalloendopeptidase [Thalassovita sp.]